MSPGSTVKISLLWTAMALLLAGAICTLAGENWTLGREQCRTVLTSPSTVVMENSEGLWLRAPASTPASTEIDSHIRLTSTTESNVFQLNYDGTMLPVEVHARELSYVDPATNQLNLLSLLYFDVSGKRIWTTGPDSDALALRFNPQVSYQAVFASDGGLYYVDAQAGQVSPIGDHQTRRATWMSSGGRPARELLDWADSPMWSPDGSKIIYSSSRSGRPALWIYDFEHSVEQPIYTSPGPALSVMSWFREDQVLFELLPTSSGAAPGTIQRLSLSRQTVTTVAEGEPLSLSPDNTHLFYALEGDHGVQIYDQALEGGSSRLVAALPEARLERPVCADLSHDAQQLSVAVQMASAVQLVDIELRTGRILPRQVGAGVGRVSALLSTPGGTFAALSSEGAAGGTVLFPPAR